MCSLFSILVVCIFKNRFSHLQWIILQEEREIEKEEAARAAKEAKKVGGGKEDKSKIPAPTKKGKICLVHFSLTG